MGSQEEKDDLLKDEGFWKMLLLIAIGKVKDKTIASDLVSSTLIDFERKPEVKIRPIDNLRGYVCRILTKKLNWRHYKKDSTETLSLSENKYDVQDTAVTDPLDKLLFEQIEQSVKKNKSETAVKVFELHFKRGYPSAEIARMLDKEPGNIRKIIHEIRQFIRNGFRNEQ